MNNKLIFQARKFLAAKERKRTLRIRKLFLNATRDFEKMKAVVIRKYQPRKIYQWGSLLHREHFSEISDIDMAVEGITDAKKFFQMYSELWKMTCFPLHLVQLENIHPVYAKWIKQHGKVVYEKEK